MKTLGRADVIKEMTRLCTSYSCTDCPLTQRREDLGLDISCRDFKLKRPIEVFLVLEKWVSEHPEKTLLSDFLEKYPNATVDDDGTPVSTCPHHLGHEQAIDRPCKHSSYNCLKCWSRPLERD